MRNKLSTILTTLLIGLLMFNILSDPAICIKGAESGLLLWFNKLLPSLLPFIILTNMLFNLGIIFKLSRLLNPITLKLFKISGSSFLTFIMGIIGGYPTGAKLSKQLLDSHSISFSEAQKTICFSNNCGCLFIIGTVGSILLGNPALGYFLVFVHICSAFTMLLLFRFYTPPYAMPERLTTLHKPASSPSFATAFTSAVQNAMDTIVYVGGYIIFFSVIISILKSSPIIQKSLEFAATSTGFPSHFLTSLLLGSFEFSNGVALVCSQPTLNLQGLGIISAIIAFGGLCVLFQSAHLLQGSNLSLGIYILSKLFQSGIAYFYTLLFYPVFFVYTNQTSGSLLKQLFILGILFFTLILTLKALSHTQKKISVKALSH
ncbi:MAG: hypothetical protein ACRC1P_08015 [Cellulosilyticaceae bacterium]